MEMRFDSGKAGNPIYRKVVVGRLTMRQQHAKYSNNRDRCSARDLGASNYTGNEMESGWTPLTRKLSTRE